MINYNSELQIWTVSWKNTSWEIRFRDHQLVAQFFGPSHYEFYEKDEYLRLGRPASAHARGECIVYINDSEEPVSWESVEWDQQGSTLSIQLANTYIKAEIQYEFLPELGIIYRHTKLTNKDRDPIQLNASNSFTLVLPRDEEYNILYLNGEWGHEYQVAEAPIGNFDFILQSKEGKTGFGHAPWFAVKGRDGVWLGTLVWAGNWQIHARQYLNQPAVVTGGIHSHKLNQILHPGEELELPSALMVYSDKDLNEAVHSLHDFQRRNRPHPDRPIPVQFNAWYPYQGEPDEEKVMTFIDHAEQLSCEIFVLDAGWYTTEVVNELEPWSMRTGDWILNRKNFPNGLEPVIERCKQKGLKFGIWMEPEAIGPSSWVAHNRPEWCFPSEQSGVKVLNLGIPEAREWARNKMFKVLEDTGADWLKWDFNRSAFPENKPLENGMDPLIAHTRAVLKLADEIRNQYPHLILEMCASGGGRFGTQSILHSHTYWMTDQLNPLKNLGIHFGSHLAHCAVSCNNWLISWPPEQDYNCFETYPITTGDLAFRTRVAMLGSFGISSSTYLWSPEDFSLVRKHVMLYRERIRPLVHHGDQYMLTKQPSFLKDEDWAAMWYISKDRKEGVLFAFRLANGEKSNTFSLPGLFTDRIYELEFFNGEKLVNEGSDLQKGITVSCQGAYTSELILIRLKK